MASIIAFFLFVWIVVECKDKISDKRKARKRKKEHIRFLIDNEARMKKERQELRNKEKQLADQLADKEKEINKLKNEISSLKKKQATREDTKKDLIELVAQKIEMQKRHQELLEKELHLTALDEKIHKREKEVADAYGRFAAYDVKFLEGFPVNDPVSKWPPDLRKRLFHAANEHMTLESLGSFTATVMGEGGKTYQTSLTGCSCADFIYRRQTCKHMMFLAMSLGWNCFEHGKQTKAQLSDINSRISVLESKEQNAAKIERHTKALKDDMRRLLKENEQTYPWLSKMIADLHTRYDDQLAEEIKSKRNPAKKASENIKQLSQDYKAALIKQKQLEYQLHVYEAAFPFLEEFKAIPPAEAMAERSIVCDQEREFDRSRKYMSKKEYAKLPPAERDQLALERYLKRSKSSWDAGIEYEQYIGHLCELRGYRVTYVGATKGLEDMGQDLILQKGNDQFVIQCKRWHAEKTIHEKHIFQLYGTVVLSKLAEPETNIQGIFVTSTALSPLAMQCAEHLGIQVYENIPMAEFPRIKCNLSHNGEKIYHLPFDISYDRVHIEPEKGEFFASTVQEALDAGYRRAWRWRNNNK